MPPRHFFTTILLFLLILNAASQNPLYRRFNDSSGLQNRSIYDIYQDSKGLIWLGTDEGLIRFDGRNFQRFPAHERFRKGITNILEDENSNIYCQNFAGQVFKVLPSSDSLSHLQKIQGLGRFSEITMIKGYLIAYSGPEYISYLNTRDSNIILTKVKSSDSRISFFTRNSANLCVVNTKEKELLTLDNQQVTSTNNFEVEASVLFHATINEKKYVINRLYPFETVELSSGKQIALPNLSEDIIINHVSLIDNQHLGIFTTSGLYVYDTNFKLIWHWFKNESISGGFKDKQNNYWLSTLQDGLILVTQPKLTVGLENQNLTCITSDGANFIIGTADNKILLTDKTSVIKVVYNDPTHHPMRRIVYNKYNNELLFSNQFFNILSKGNLFSQKISVNDISLIEPDSYLLAESSTISILPGKRIDKNIADFSKHSNQKDNRLLLSDDVIRAEHAIQVNTNSILVSTTDGLLSLNAHKREEVLYDNNKIFATSIAKKNNDSTFIATMVDGILLYSQQKLKPYLQRKTLQQQAIKKIKSTENHLYILYSNALDVFDYKKIKVQSLSTSDGIDGYNFNDIFVTKDSVIIASDKGLISFALNDIQPNQQPPVIEILSTRVNQSIVDSRKFLSLNSPENVIEIEFAIIDYKGIESSKAFYSLNGGDWIKANGSKIILTSLAAGEYTLRIKAVNERGISTEKPTELIFKIPTPWYGTWWFLSIIAFIIATVITLYYKRRLSRAQKSNRLLNEKIELEKALHQSTLTSIKAQMNPHFIFNALNTIQSYIYTNDKHAASKYLVDFSELTRLILAMSNQDSVSLTDEIKTNTLYLKLEKMRFEDDFEYIINIAKIDTDNIRIPPMLIQPYIENAIKHGLLHKKNDKKLQVNFSVNGEFLDVDIIDNGIGILASSQINNQRRKNHQSFAIQANKKRLDILNSGLQKPIGEEIISLFDHHGVANGTHVKLKIPIT